MKKKGTPKKGKPSPTFTYAKVGLGKRNTRPKKQAKRKAARKSKAQKLPVKKKMPRPRKRKILFKARKIKPSTAKTADIFDGIHKTKIMVIGIGGGGGSIVSEIASRVKKASFVAANTDLQALKKSVGGIRLFQFGQALTHGLGTGMNSELGKIAAQQEREKIKKILEGQDLCVLIACLGGGTGSGAAPIFAKISKDLGNLTYGIFTLPFEFEGEKKNQIAREALERLKSNVNTFSVIPNERIFQIIDKETPLKAALSVINKSLAEGLEGLIEMIYDPGLINIDFADLRTIFDGRGKLTYLNTTEVSGPGRSEEVLRSLISNPLYPHTIRGAKGILFNIAGEKTLALDEISQISKNISNLAHKEAKIIFGISQENKSKDKIKVTLLATGCSLGVIANRIKTEPRRKKITQKPLQAKKIKQEAGRSPVPQTKTPAQKLSSGGTKTTATPKGQSKHPSQKRQDVLEKGKKAAPVQLQRQKQPQIKEKTPLSVQSEDGLETKVRRNGLQIKKETQEIEQELLNQEKQWEVPAFLRRQMGEK